MEQAKLQATSYNCGQPQPPLVNYNQTLPPQGYNPYAPVYANQPFNGIPMGVQPMQIVMVQVDPLSQEELNIQRDMSRPRRTFFIFLIILACFDALGIFA